MESMRMSGIGHTLTYAVKKGDLGVSFRNTGTHRTYSMVVDGSATGINGPWFKLDIYCLVGSGKPEKQPGAFTVTEINEPKYFAVDALNPVPLTHVRGRIQQWLGPEGTAINVVAEGVDFTPKQISDTGGNVAFGEIHGNALWVEAGTDATKDGYTEPANIGDRPQMMFGVNVTAVELTAGTTIPKFKSDRAITTGVVFVLQTQGVDGVWYDVWSSDPFNAAGQFWTSVGPMMEVEKLTTNIVRIGWRVPTATVAKVTFSASLATKPQQST